jgi:hypothetical protein
MPKPSGLAEEEVIEIDELDDDEVPVVHDYYFLLTFLTVFASPKINVSFTTRARASRLLRHAKGRDPLHHHAKPRSAMQGHLASSPNLLRSQTRICLLMMKQQVTSFRLCPPFNYVTPN